MRRQVTVRRGAVLVAMVAALLGLSGCFKASQDVRVKADGSGAVILHAEVDKKALAEVLGRIGGAGGATLTPMRPVDRTFPDGTKVRVVDRPGRATLDASFAFRGPDEYTRKLQQVSQAISDPGAAAADQGSIQIRRTGDRVEVALDVGSSAGSADGLDLSALSGLLGPAALPTFVVTITMPGTILATNGKTQGRTATWDISKDAPALLTASSTLAVPGPALWPPLLGAGLILLVLGVTITFFVSQRRHAARAAPGVVEPESWGSAHAPSIGTFFPPAPGPPEGWPAPSPAGPPPPAPPPPAWQAATWSSPNADEPEAPPEGPEAPPAAWSSPFPPPPSPVPPSAGWSPPSPPPPPSAVPPSAGWSAPPPPPTGPAPWIPRPIGPSSGAPPAPGGAGDPVAAPAGPALGDPLAWRVPGPPAAPPRSPPDPSAASTDAAAPVPGWYADPAGGSGLRYWDGRRWTRHTT